MSRILLVEDDASFRESMYKVLTRAGHDVQEADNGRVALQQLHDHPADVVITDIVMPEQEGLETIIRLRRTNPHVKVIAISGGGSINAVDYLRTAKKLGALATLAKPFSRQEILTAIEQVLALPDGAGAKSQ